MPPNFPDLLRDELTLDQQLVDQMKLPPGRFEVLILARRLRLAGATFVDKDVRIFADIVENAANLGSAAGITLTTPGVAGRNTTGAPGPTLTIWCKSLRAAGGRSRGQRGGVGLPGGPGADAVCLPPPDPIQQQPGDQPRREPIDPIEQQEGEPGKQGKPGAKGGSGGHIEVHVVGGIQGGQDWLGVGGPGGGGGQGGPGGKGCPKPIPAPEGTQGGTLGPGDSVPGTVTPATEAQYLAEIQARVVDFVWADLRTGAADELARRGEPEAAELELVAAAKLEPPRSAALQLRRRMRHALTPAGVERDVDVVPAVDKHHADWTAALTTYHAAAMPSGTSVFRFLGRQELLDRYAELRTAHAKLIEVDLQQLDTDRLERISDLADARKVLGDLIPAAQQRIAALVDDQGVPPGITVPGGAVVNAKLLADRITTILGAPLGTEDPLARRLLAADLDLLAPGAANDQYPMPGSEALFLLRSHAVGLAGGNPAGSQRWELPGVVVGFRAVRRELLAAAGDRRLLLELTELAELAQRSRMVQLRELQTAEGGLLQADLRDRTGVTSFNLQGDPDLLSTEGLALNYLDANQDFADVMAWRAHAPERAASVYTLDSTALGKQFPELGTTPTTAFGVELFNPDRREELRQHLGFPGPTLNTAIAGVTDANPTVTLNAYLARGTFVAGPGSSAVDPLVFSSDEQPEVLARLKLFRNVWFQAGPDRLQQARFEGKVVGVGFVFEGLAANTAPGQQIRELDLIVEHSGISVQRRLDGVEVPQYLNPGEIRVTIHQRRDGVNGPFTDVWSGFMRYDDVVPPENPDDPGQTVGKPEDFPLWGRGAAAGWRLRFDNPALPVLTNLRRFDFEVEYDAFTTPGGAVSLRRIEQPLDALVPGRTVQARAVLTGPAPAGGLKVSLTSDNPGVLSVPAAVVAPAGADRVDLPVTVVAAGGGPVRLTARTPDGFTRRALATVPTAAANQPPTVSSLDVKEPGDPNGNVGGLVFDGDRLLAAYQPSVLRDDGTLEPTGGPGGMIGLTLAAGKLTGLQRLPGGIRPRTLTLANRRAYLISADPADFGLTIVDLTTNKPIAHQQVGFGPTQVAVDGAANLAYVGVFGSRSVDVLDATTAAKVATVPNIRGPQGLAIDTKRRLIYVAATFRSNGPDDEENGLAVISRSATGQHTVTIKKMTAFQPMDVALDAARGLLHVANLGGGGLPPGITTFRTTDLAELAFVPVPGPVICLDLHQASGAVFAGGPAPSVHVVDGVNRRYLTSHKVTDNVQSIVVHQPTGAVFTGDRVSGRIARLAPVDTAITAWR